MYYSLACGMLIAGLAFFLIYVIGLVYSNLTLEKQSQCAFRNSFPYNFYLNFSVVNRLTLYLLLLASALFVSVGDMFFFISLSTSYMTIAGLLFSLSYLALCVGNIIPLSSYKAHIILEVSGMFVFAMISCLFCFSSLIPGATTVTYPLHLGVAIPIGVMGFISLIAMFNPKLTSWAKMDKTEEDGKTVYVKPKVNYLALYEWIFLLEGAVAGFLFMLNIVLTTANI